MELNQSNVDLNYLTPTVTMDGHVVVVSDQGVPTLIFFQARSQGKETLNADVVASIRMNNLEDLKTLNKAIDDTVKKHSEREP